MTRTCKYEPCSKEFEPKRPHQVFCSDKCRYAGWVEEPQGIRQGGGQRVGEHPLQEVRDQRATEKHNRDLGGLIKQAIADQIKTTGSCHADDLIDLYPEGEVDLCRRLATAQFGSLAARKLIRKDGWRRTSSGSRKGGGGWIWKFTEKGRQELSKLVGSSAGEVRGSSPAPGENPEPQGRNVPVERPGALGTNPSCGSASPEPLQLDLAKSPSMFDPDQRAA